MLANGRQGTYEDCGGAGVLERAGASRLLKGNLGLHTLHRLSVLVKCAVATRNGECVLRSLQSYRSLTSFPEVV